MSNVTKDMYTYKNPQNSIKDGNVNHFVTIEDFLSTEISCFENIKSVEPHLITIKKWLGICTNPISAANLCYKEKVGRIRLSKEIELKKTLPAACFGALLNTRNKNVAPSDKIKMLTGFMQFDIDLKDNPKITDAIHLREQIKNISYVAVSSLSVSGNGVWGLVKVEQFDRYKEHFEQLKIDFASRGIKLDPSKGGNPTDLRIYSYDPNLYVANKFKIYNRLLLVPEKQVKLISDNTKKGNRSKVENLIKELRNLNIDLTPNYESYRNIGFSIAHEFGESGRNLFHAICNINAQYKEKETDKQFTSCLKSQGQGITIATFFFLCKQKGL